MLLCKEFLIGAIRTLQPTYDSLSVISEYILLFADKMDEILEVLVKESRESNAYSILFILYLINELIIKNENKSLLKAGKEILEIGKTKTEELQHNGPEGIKKSANSLIEKYLEMERLWEKKTQKKKEVTGLPLDVEYLEELCKRKNTKEILKYIKEINKSV